MRKKIEKGERNVKQEKSQKRRKRGEEKIKATFTNINSLYNTRYIKQQ